MKTYFKSEAPEDSFYIHYFFWNEKDYCVKEVEFWTDDIEEYFRKLGFIGRHIKYELVTSRAPLTNPA